MHMGGLPFKCAVCGHVQRLPKEVKGRKFRCPGCKVRLRHYEDDWFEVLDKVDAKPKSDDETLMPQPPKAPEETRSGHTRSG
jgi:hypothetical protein